MSILLIGALSDSEYIEWRTQLAHHLPRQDSIVPGNGGYDSNAVEIALVANPPVGSLANLPNLRFIQSLWAGVDRLLSDSSLPPDIPIARLIDPSMTEAMVECAIAHTFFIHRQMPAYLRQQSKRTWQPQPQKLAASCRVGVLGLGALGMAVARALSALGFPVEGWTLHPRTSSELATHHGIEGLKVLASRSRILINLLPLTPQTTGILNAQLFQQLPAGAALINLARGKHVVEADLLTALDDGRLGHAVLDVFAVEPLPASHPFWTHPQITVMPHVAAESDPVSAARIVADNVAAFRAGRPVTGMVTRSRGY